MRINDLPSYEKPREKALRYGIDKLSNPELIAVIISTGYIGKSSVEIGYDLLSIFRNFNNLSNCSIEELKSIKGIGDAKAISLLAAFEFHKRAAKNIIDQQEILSSDQIYNIFAAEMSNLPQEICKVVLLNSKHKIIKILNIAKGTLNYHIIHPRDVFRDAVKENAAKIVLIHNHPSGDPSPSKDDIETTLSLNKIGSEVGIKLLDHIIIGKDKFYSFKKDNII